MKERNTPINDKICSLHVDPDQFSAIICKDGDGDSSDEDSRAIWPIYSGINKSFSKMMQIAGNAMSKKLQKNLEQLPVVKNEPLKG